jgi:DNA-directed RNA polymerase specialized sigma24 family protein
MSMPTLPVPSGWRQALSQTEWGEDDRLDAELMCEVKYHDSHEAFERLLPRLRRAIEGPLRRLLPRHELEDGLAEVVSRIFIKRRLYDETRGLVRWWAGGISRHYGLDWRRRHAARRVSSIGHGRGAVALIAAKGPDPAAQVEQADWAAFVNGKLAEVFASMPTYVGVAWEMRLQGVAFREIARLLGVRSIGTVASALFRARAKVRALPGGLAGVEPELREVAGADVRARLSEVRDCLEALAEGKVAGDGAALQSVRLAGLIDAVGKLAPLRGRLPRRLFTQLWTHADELRERFGDHGFDNHAYRQTRAHAQRVRRAIG